MSIYTEMSKSQKKCYLAKNAYSQSQSWMIDVEWY